MIHIGLGVIMLAMVPLRGAAHQGSKPSPAAAEAKAREVMADLREARELVRDVNDRRTRERLELVLGRAELRMHDVLNHLGGSGSAARPAATSAEDFARLMKSLKAEAFDDKKLAL